MDLLISTNASASRATVQRAAPGELRSDTFVVRPGESVLDVPYDAWLARVGETVELRELQDGTAAPGEREQGFWTTPLGPKARAVMALTAAFLYIPVALQDPYRGALDTAWLVLLCSAAVHLALKNLLELPLPQWVSYPLLAAFAVLAVITFLG